MDQCVKTFSATGKKELENLALQLEATNDHYYICSLELLQVVS